MKHIKYYRMSDGKFMFDQDKTIGLRSQDGFNATVASVVMLKEIGSTTVANSHVWAKKGYVRVILSKNNANMSYIKFSGAYGHLVVKIASPSISIGNGLSISFGPSQKVQTKARQRYKITANGVVTKI